MKAFVRSDGRRMRAVLPVSAAQIAELPENGVLQVHCEPGVIKLLGEHASEANVYKLEELLKLIPPGTVFSEQDYLGEADNLDGNW